MVVLLCHSNECGYFHKLIVLSGVGPWYHLFGCKIGSQTQKKHVYRVWGMCMAEGTQPCTGHLCIIHAQRF